MDKDLKNILDDLEDEGIETFNRSKLVMII